MSLSMSSPQLKQHQARNESQHELSAAQATPRALRSSKQQLPLPSKTQQVVILPSWQSQPLGWEPS